MPINRAQAERAFARGGSLIFPGGNIVSAMKDVPAGFVWGDAVLRDSPEHPENIAMRQRQLTNAVAPNVPGSEDILRNALAAYGITPEDLTKLVKGKLVPAQSESFEGSESDPDTLAKAQQLADFKLPDRNPNRFDGLNPKDRKTKEQAEAEEDSRLLQEYEKSISSE